MRIKNSHNPAGQLRIRAKGSHNPSLVWRLKANLDGTLSKNLLNKLVKPAQKLIKWVTKISSKMREPKIYNKIVNNLINRNR